MWTTAKISVTIEPRVLDKNSFSLRQMLLWWSLEDNKRLKGSTVFCFWCLWWSSSTRTQNRPNGWAIAADKQLKPHHAAFPGIMGHTSAPVRNSCEALQSIPLQKDWIKHSHSGVKRRFAEMQTGSSACPRGHARYSSAGRFKRRLLHTSREEILLERSGWTLSSQTGESAAR